MNDTKFIEVNNEKYTIRFENEARATLWKGMSEMMPSPDNRIDLIGVGNLELWSMVDLEPNRFALFINEYMGKEMSGEIFRDTVKKLPDEQTLSNANDLGIKIEESPYDISSIDAVQKENDAVKNDRNRRMGSLTDRMAKIEKERKQNKKTVKKSPKAIETDILMY